MTGKRPAWVSRQTAVDVALAASTTVLDLLLFSTVSTDWSGNADAWRVIAIGAVAFAALLVRRRYPVAVFAVVWACAVLAAPLGGMDFTPTATTCVALFTVALHASSRVAVVALLACAVPALTSSLLEARSRTQDEATVALYATMAFNLLLYGCVWAGGRWARLSRQHAEDLEFRRRVAAQEAVAVERTRIARELHDIVAHSVTVMVLQAAGARRVLDSDPVRVGQALRHIEEAGEQAMGELRRMLTALRLSHDDEDLESGGVNGLPQPGLADLDQLVGAISAAGVRVHTRVEGEPRRLAASVDLAAYRVVQEALTNVTKHVGPGAAVDVRLGWADGELTVEVTDDGRGRRPERTFSTDHGLAGLRERLAIVGGRLEANPLPAGGFRVVAVFPVSGPVASEAVGERR
ncbi:signal transduction histidine kinase [Saccharothrix ecbatanensis]|uniref:histidine kinase n=1 Tax=Saccharothrix ecbatanensis TaxID=1105145 RepID=A0A7W9M0C9_9PSEU|nr:sensor histidine kinase [Saccharothrix ecbatanensis]MBB5802736.1 signal transduction histidine kinase [Saccharothrix ecbatanensis]